MEAAKTAIEIIGFLTAVAAAVLWATSALVQLKGFVDQKRGDEGGTGLVSSQTEENIRALKRAFGRQSSLSLYAALASAAAALSQGVLIAFNWVK